MDDIKHQIEHYEEDWRWFVGREPRDLIDNLISERTVIQEENDRLRSSIDELVRWIEPSLLHINNRIWLDDWKRKLGIDGESK